MWLKEITSAMFLYFEALGLSQSSPRPSQRRPKATPSRPRVSMASGDHYIKKLRRARLRKWDLLYSEWPKVTERLLKIDVSDKKDSLGPIPGPIPSEPVGVSSTREATF